MLVAENARDAQLREGPIGYPCAVGQQMRRSRSISPHRDPDSAPIRVLLVQRSVFCPSHGILPSVLPSKGCVSRVRFALGRSRVLQSADGKRARRMRDVGRIGDDKQGEQGTEGRCRERTSVPCSPSAATDSRQLAALRSRPRLDGRFASQGHGVR